MNPTASVRESHVGVGYASPTVWDGKAKELITVQNWAPETASRIIHTFSAKDDASRQVDVRHVKLGAICGLSSAMLVTLLGQSRIFFSMSRDGLLPKWASIIHPRFRTPYISTIFVGVSVATIAALTPINVISELVSIGTLLAFVIVCGGVWILRWRGRQVPRAFVAPWIPFTPIMGISVSLLMMISLGWETWARLIIWLVIGLIIYFLYGRKHSRVRIV